MKNSVISSNDQLGCGISISAMGRKDILHGKQNKEEMLI